MRVLFFFISGASIAPQHPDCGGILTKTKGCILIRQFGKSGVSVKKRWRRFSVKCLRRALALGVLMPVGLQAQTGSNILRDREATSAPKAGRKQHAGVLRFESMQYFTEVPEVPELTRSQFLSASVRSSGSFDSIRRMDYRADFSAGTFFSRSQTEFAVSELAVGGRLSEQVRVDLGRKLERWSELDSRWQMGLWQPRFALDALRNQEQGLTGVFASYEQPQARLVGFVTPVFIPTMTPPVREEGGSLVSDSRWYRQPSSLYSFSNRINQISYRLDIPETSQLVMNPGSGLKADFGRADGGAWLRTAWAYKPVNELLLRRQNFKSVAADRVDVTVSPDVTYHRVTSADLGYRFNSVGASVSYVEDSPGEKRPDAEWSIQKLKPLRAYSAQVDWDLADTIKRDIQIRMSYLKVDGGGIEDIQSDGTPDEFTLFDHRTQFSDAVSVSLEGQLARVANRPLTARWRYLYDWDQDGSMMNTEFQYSPEPRWAVVVGADVLGVQDETRRPSGFLNQFRANDRFYGGMTYVF